MRSGKDGNFEFDMDFFINHVPGGIAIYKLTDPVELLYFNDGVCALTGHTREEYSAIIAEDGMSTVYNKDRPLLEAEIVSAIAEDRKVDFTYRICHKTEGLVWVHLSAVKRGELNGERIYYAMFMDISSERKTQKLLKELAERDNLTGAFNRIAFEKEIEEHLLKSEELPSAFIMLDIDNFKRINDFLGHTKGDEVLCMTAGLLTVVFGEEALVARMGGDEFAVFIPSVRSFDGLVELVEQFCQRIKRDYAYQDSSIPLSCSLGIAFAPKDGDSYTSLYANADKALLCAKDNGKAQYQFFGDFIEPASSLRLRNMEWLLDEGTSGIYVCNSETYELLYMNKLCHQMAGVKGNTYLGKKCYEELMHMDAPCPFCKMKDMKIDQFLERRFAVPKTDTILSMKGKLIKWNGIKAHVEFISPV